MNNNLLLAKDNESIRIQNNITHQGAKGSRSPRCGTLFPDACYMIGYAVDALSRPALRSS